MYMLASSSSTLPNINEKELIKRLSVALESAQGAVEEDEKSNFSRAITKYNEAIAIMESEVGNVTPASRKEILLNKLNLYKKRVRSLEKYRETGAGMVLRRQTKTKPAPMFPVAWLPMKLPPPEGLEPAPADPVRRPFWLMKRIAHSLDSGYYISEHLYISRVVWYQSEVKYIAIQHKIACLEALRDGFINLRVVDIKDVDQTCQHLGAFVEQLDSIQAMLAKHLSHIKPPVEHSLLRDIGARAVRGAGVLKTNFSASTTDPGQLGLLLLDIFQKAKILEIWIDIFEEKKAEQPLELLKRVSNFFGTVLLNFVMRDLSMMCMQYMKKMSNLFVSYAG
eukprot:TRINITY_DN7917_c0_g1_i1.p1 TRINITY_DN7917_c0_g1~~TRINITY_DN7917_c0_g1_i1.p1  ORF type:complete len:337 (+),score=46.14 TRINITY_DN7917_c0_g1_i1:52-1062(+)